ncbi:MAG TPA: hypothetical protein VLI55_07160 [Bryobacteraceae bacterium]|nr:hypothetical protein [Bryobacteraceae bacterium]
MNVNLILPDDIGAQLKQIAVDRGFSSMEGFIHAAIQNEMERHLIEKTPLERLSEALYQLWEQTGRLVGEEGTTPRFIQSLTNLIFACTAEFESHVFAQAVSIKGRRRR